MGARDGEVRSAELDAILARFGDAAAIASLQARLEPAPAHRDPSGSERQAFRTELDEAAEREAEVAGEVAEMLWLASHSGRPELVPSMCRHLDSDLRSYPLAAFEGDPEPRYYEDEFFVPIPEAAVEALQEVVPAVEHPEHGDTVAAWKGWCRTRQSMVSTYASPG